MFDAQAGAPAGIADRLRQQGRKLWAAAVDHPMVNAIGDGSLPQKVFRGYFVQNIAYLEDYTRALGATLSKAPDEAALAVVARAIEQIVHVELPKNRSFLERLGGDGRYVLSPGEVHPTTYAYGRHLLATAALGDCAAGLTAILPCQWSYGEIGEKLLASAPTDDIYADWIAVFSEPEYEELVNETTALLDRLADGDDPATFARLSQVFDASSRFEVAFWDMAYREL
ncbi:MAG: thiaminase [Acidimicrobiaceae bacterium]|nr:thiaminase [Acidimicrobiaceae bacterium]